MTPTAALYVTPVNASSSPTRIPVASNVSSSSSTGRLPLDDAYQLVLLYAEKGDCRFEKAALRWLGRYVTEKDPTLLDVAAVAASRAERGVDA